MAVGPACAGPEWHNGTEESSRRLVASGFVGRWSCHPIHHGRAGSLHVGLVLRQGYSCPLLSVLLLRRRRRHSGLWEDQT